jgi:hypothetical protein
MIGVIIEYDRPNNWVSYAQLLPKRHLSKLVAGRLFMADSPYLLNHWTMKF